MNLLLDVTFAPELDALEVLARVGGEVIEAIFLHQCNLISALLLQRYLNWRLYLLKYLRGQNY